MLSQIFGLILFCILGVAIAGHYENYLIDQAICHLKVHYGYCGIKVYSWYYNPKRNVCLRFRYALCGGNKNRFYTREECESVCLRNW